MNSVETYGALSELPSDVGSFISEQSRDQLWLDETWFDLLMRYSPMTGHRPRIYVVRSGGEGRVDCVLFTASVAPGRMGRNRRLVSLTNFYTMSYAPLARSGSSGAAAALQHLATAIMRERPAWDVIELRSLIREMPTTTELVRAFRKAGMLVDTYFQFENWYQPTIGLTAAQYFKSRRSQLRNTVTRKLAKARKQHRLDIRIYISPAELAKGMEDYRTIYAHSWKEPEAYPEFVPQLLRQSAQQGTLRLGVLSVDEEAAAAQIWLVRGSKATIYKLAYDEKFAHLSVGSILTKAMFDHVIDIDHVAEIDYGVGSEPYKLDWMAERRHIIGLIGFNPRSIRGLLAAGKHFAGRRIRSFWAIEPAKPN